MIFEFENFVLYQNPNNGSFKISNRDQRQIKITISDISGKIFIIKHFKITGMFDQESQIKRFHQGIFVNIQNGENKKKILDFVE
jgi:hypothetical protein